MFILLVFSFLSVSGLEDAINDVVNLRHGLALDGPRVGHGDLGTSDAAHGSVHVVKRLRLHHNASDFSSNAVLRPSFLNAHNSVSLLHRVDDRVAVKGLDGAEVNDLAADVVVACENLSSLNREADHFGVGDNSAVSASSLDLSLADGDDEIFVHNRLVVLKLDTVHHLVLEEHDGIIVTDGGLEEATSVLDAPGADDFESWDLSVPGSKALSMLGTNSRADTINSAEDDRAGEVAIGHVEGLGGGVDNMVDRLQGEVEGHELDDGAEAFETSTDGDTSEASLSDWSVPDALRAIFVPHALGHFVGAVVLGDLFANQENPFVTLDLVTHSSVDGVTDSHLVVGDRRRGKCAGLGGSHSLEERCRLGPLDSSLHHYFLVNMIYIFLI